METNNQERLLAVLCFLGVERYFETLVINMFDCDICLLADGAD